MDTWIGVFFCRKKVNFYSMNSLKCFANKIIKELTLYFLLDKQDIHYA